MVVTESRGQVTVWRWPGFLGLALCVWLLVAAPAQAERDPSPSETVAIEKAARHAQSYRQYPIEVTASDIEISTVGRWATAAVVVRAPQNSMVLQEIQETYYRAPRGWIGSENAHFPSRVMPAKVERDLGFSPQGSSDFDHWVKIVVWVVMGLGALAVLAGIGWVLSLFDGGGGTSIGAPAPSLPRPVSYEPSPPRRKGRVPCPGGCQAGRTACPGCGWVRVVKDDLTSVYGTCEVCGGQLFTCPTCNGAGSIEVEV